MLPENPIILRFSLNSLSRVCAALALASILSQSAFAAILTNNNSANINWSGAGTGQMFNVNPANNTTNTFVFATTSGSAQATNNQDLTGAGASNIIFNAAAVATIIGGNSLTLSGAITNNSTALQTLNIQLILLNNVNFFTTAGGGNLLFGGILSGAGGFTKLGVDCHADCGQHLHGRYHAECGLACDQQQRGSRHRDADLREQ